MRDYTGRLQGTSLRLMGRSKEVVPGSVFVTEGKWSIKNGKIVTLSKAPADMT
jgi:hypothetical protein